MSSLFIDAILGRPIPRFPIWMMRQAGRYLPEYKKLKQDIAGGSFWRMVKDPQLAAEVTMQPLKRMKVDALILFSDILTPLPAMGFEVDFVPHPKIAKTATEIGIDKILVPDDLSEQVSFVAKSIHRIKATTAVPLIGFCGAPYTLACYLLKDELDKDFSNPRKLYYHDSQLFKELLDKLSLTMIDYLNLQMAAGVDAVMIFDTWAGSLSLQQYEVMAAPFVKKIIENLTSEANVPTMYYTSGTSNLISGVKKLNVDVIVADWRSDLELLKNQLAGKQAISGNLDPAVLFGSEESLRKEVFKILNTMNDYKKFVFNVGHGIHQNTPLDNVQKLVSIVRSHFISL